MCLPFEPLGLADLKHLTLKTVFAMVKSMHFFISYQSIPAIVPALSLSVSRNDTDRLICTVWALRFYSW